MNDDTLVADVIRRLLARRPDLWPSFHTDPLGTLEEARISVSDAEREALTRVGQPQVSRLAPKRHADDDALAAALRADLEAARAARALDFNPLAAESEPKEAPSVDDALLDEQRRLKARTDALRASLAEEQKRLADERAAALRRLGGGKSDGDK